MFRRLRFVRQIDQQILLAVVVSLAVLLVLLVYLAGGLGGLTAALLLAVICNRRARVIGGCYLRWIRAISV